MGSILPSLSKNRNGSIMKPSNGFWGEKGTRAFISGNKDLKMREPGEKKQFGETWNIGTHDFEFGEQGYLRNKRFI